MAALQTWVGTTTAVRRDRVDLVFVLGLVHHLMDGPSPGVGDEVLFQHLVCLQGQALVVGGLGIGQYRPDFWRESIEEDSSLHGFILRAGQGSNPHEEVRGLEVAQAPPDRHLDELVLFLDRGPSIGLDEGIVQGRISAPDLGRGDQDMFHLLHDIIWKCTNYTVELDYVGSDWWMAVSKGGFHLDEPQLGSCAPEGGQLQGRRVPVVRDLLLNGMYGLH